MNITKRHFPLDMTVLLKEGIVGLLLHSRVLQTRLLRTSQKPFDLGLQLITTDPKLRL